MPVYMVAVKNPYTIRVKISRWLGWLVVACLFNTLIDPPDSYNSSVKGDNLALNEIESIYEWMLEEVADIENAVPEQDENDNNQNRFGKDTHDWYIQVHKQIQLLLPVSTSLFVAFNDPAFLSFVTEMNSPPPEYAC